MGAGGAEAGPEEQPGAANAGGGAVCCHLTFQTLLQPVRMAHPENLSHPSRVGIAIFRMQVAEGCGKVSHGLWKYIPNTVNPKPEELES